MKVSHTIAALLAGTMLAGTALAQNTDTNTNTAGSASTANGTGVGTAVVAPVNNGSTSNASTNSTSNGVGTGTAIVAPVNNGSTSTANTNSNSVSDSRSLATGGNSQAINGAAAAQNSQSASLSITSLTVIPTHTTATERFAPQVVASGLTTSNDTCMGSTSVGLSIIGGGGTAGTTWDDKACNRRQNAARLFSMGWRQESCEVLLEDPTVAEAFHRTGRHCEDIAETPMAPPPPPVNPPYVPQVPAAPAQAAPPAPPAPEPRGERGSNDQVQQNQAVATIAKPAPVDPIQQLLGDDAVLH
jgi:hypothetical protein